MIRAMQVCPGDTTGGATFIAFQTGLHRVTCTNLVEPKIVRKEGAESGTHLRLGIDWVLCKALVISGRNSRFS